MFIKTLIKFIVIFNVFKNLYSKEIDIKIGAKIEVCCTLTVDEGNTLFLWSDPYRIVTLSQGKVLKGDWSIFTSIYSDFSYAKKDNTICVTKEQSTQKENNLKFKCNVLEGGYGKTLTEEEFIIKIYEELRFVTPPPSNKSVSVGESLTVECEATGSPGLKVIWRKDGEGPLISGDSSATLNINNVTEKMNGETYTCEASISISKSNSNSLISQQMILRVLYKPTITVSMRSFHTDLGVTEIVKLTVTGNPRPNLNCRMLNIIANRIITISQPIPNSYEYHVEIGNITKEMLGDYSCSATNSIGSDDKIISIILGPENLIIISSNQTDYSNYYLLEWTVQSRAKIFTSKITIITFDGGVDSPSSERIMDGNSLSPKTLSEGTPLNNWQYKFSQTIMNLTSDKLHKITVQMCRLKDCIDAQNPAFVRTQINNGKNVAVLDDINLAQSSLQTDQPKGVVVPLKFLSVTWSSLIVLGLLIH